MIPQKAWQLSRPLAALYEGIEDNLLTSIARRLAKHMEITDTAKWELQMLAQMGAVQKDCARIIADRAGIAPQMLREALMIAAQEAVDEIEPELRTAAKQGLVKTARAPSASVRQAVNAYWGQARRSQNMVNTVMRYKVKPAWTTLIKGICGYIDKEVARRPVYDVLNRHTGAVVIGAETRQQAVRKAIGELLDKGIPAFVDKAGREWSPEAYVNMDVRTTVNNVAHQAQFNRLDDYDLDLIMVDSHSGARPKCAKDQGKLFSRANKSGITTDLHERKIRYYPWSSSSYGQPDGILGINCEHHIYPFVPGMSVQRYMSTQDKAENDRQYLESQQQRALERKVRHDKQECMVYDALGDREAYEKSAANLRAHRLELQQFTDSTGRTRRRDREQVVGFDRRQATKATDAAKVLEKRANALYDTGSTADNIKAYNRDLPVRKRIQSAEVSKQINAGQQKKHIEGTHEYVQYAKKYADAGQFGPSRLTIDQTEAQELVERYQGAGILGRRRDGTWDNTEYQRPV